MRPDKDNRRADTAEPGDQAVSGSSRADQACGRLAPDGLAPRTGSALPMIEHALLWTMRAWAIGACRRVDTSSAIHEVYEKLGIPAAAIYMDGFMWALSRGANRLLDVNCVCQPTVSQDEMALLDVLALAQERRQEAVAVLRGMTSEATAITGCDCAGRLLRLLNAAGYVMPRASAALRRHAFGTMPDTASRLLH